MTRKVKARAQLSDSLFSCPKRLRDQAQVAKACGASANEVLGAFARWVHFRRQHHFDRVTSGNLRSMPRHLVLTAGQVDSLVQLHGFAEAFAEVGWLQITAEGFVLSSAEAIRIQADRDATKARRAVVARKPSNPLAKFRQAGR